MYMALAVLWDTARELLHVAFLYNNSHYLLGTNPHFTLDFFLPATCTMDDMNLQKAGTVH